MNRQNTTLSQHQVYPPCKSACPILTDAREYVELIAKRRFEEAFAAIRKQNPLPGVCGRICTHPCETACKRGQVDEPIAIAALKRFASDGPWKSHYKQALPGQSTGHKVAVIGSGPAGLSAAHDLALLGHCVTIFEALPILGGMLRVGVPAYRLPKNVVDEEIQAILHLGIEVKTGIRIGEDMTLTDLFEQGYSALFLGIGAHKDRKLGIPGEAELKGVVSAVLFLRELSQGRAPRVGKKVAVIGGGNTAIDSARSALRLGAEAVHIVYRRSRDEMPAAQEEIEDAIREGSHIAPLTSPLEILGKEGKVSALKCVKNQLGEPDGSGRRRPKSVAGSEFTLDVDMVITAIGQAPDSSVVADEVEISEGKERIIVDGPYTLVTTRPGVFAGGDAVTGPATVVEAIAAGKRAALSIHNYLKGISGPAIEPIEPVEAGKVPPAVIDTTKKFARSIQVNLPADKRLQGFNEVVSVFSEDQATREALRCLHCFLGARVDKDRCISCLTCVRVCPLGIPTTNKMGEIAIDPVACQACGMCALECPVRAIDMSLNARRDIAMDIENGIRTAQSSGPVVVGFFDLHGNFGADDLKSLKQNHPSVAPVMVFGLRRIDTSDVLKAFESGADGVFLAACPPEADPFPKETNRLKQRMAHARSLLEAVGFHGGRLEICHMPEDGLVEEKWVSEFIQNMGDLGQADSA